MKHIRRANGPTACQTQRKDSSDFPCNSFFDSDYLCNRFFDLQITDYRFFCSKLLSSKYARARPSGGRRALGGTKNPPKIISTSAGAIGVPRCNSALESGLRRAFLQAARALFEADFLKHSSFLPPDPDFC